MRVTFKSKTQLQMERCRVVGPRGLCRPLDEKQGFPTNNSSLEVSSDGRARAGRLARRRMRVSWGPEIPAITIFVQTLKKPLGRSWEALVALGPKPETLIVGFGVLPEQEVIRGDLRHYSPRIPGGFTLPHRSDGTLGRGPRSEPRAPM